MTTDRLITSGIQTVTEPLRAHLSSLKLSYVLVKGEIRWCDLDIQQILAAGEM